MITPTQLIFDAWKQTNKPIIYQTNDAKGEPLEVLCDFLNPNDLDTVVKQEIVCTICGKKADEGIPGKQFFSANYTDWQMHKEPMSEFACLNCVFTMSLNAKAGRMTLSRYSFCASTKLEVLNRGQIRDRIINPPNPPFVMAVAVSQKKHIAIKSKVSYSRNKFLVNMEEETISVDLTTAKHYIKIIESLRGIGFTKEEIENKRIRFDKIKEYEFDTAGKINNLYDKLVDKRLTKLLVFVAKKEELEDSLCFLDLIQRTNTPQLQPYLSTRSTNQETLKEDHKASKCGDKSSGFLGHPQNEQLTLDLF